MADAPDIEVNGLQLSNNTFSASPPGSLAVAVNVVMPQKGVAEPRRGQDIGAATPGGVVPMQLTRFQAQTLTNYASNKLSTSYGLGYVNGSSVSAYSGGPYNPVDCDGSAQTYGRMKFGFAASFLHFCTTTGPKTLETYNGTPRASGLLQPPDPTGFAFKATGNNWLPYGSSVAVRTLVRRETSTGVSLESPSSSAAVITNRVLMPGGALTKTGGVATGVLPGGQRTGFIVGSTFTLTPGEADFPAGAYTVASIPTASSFTFAITAGTATNTVSQDADTGDRAILVEANLPRDAVAGDSVREYRSLYTTTATPPAELFLSNETLLTSGEIGAGQALIEDTTPQSVLDDPLYTNPQTGEGAQQANFQPPLYRDTSNWSGMQFYFNTTGQQQFRLQMLGVGSPNGVQDGDTLTIADGGTSVTFTFLNSPAASTDVQIYSSGLPSQNIAGTAANLISRFYVNAPPEWALFSESGTVPGKLRLERTDFGASPFEVTASRPESWTPALDSSTPTLSSAERNLNGFAWSKPGQPEAVPLLNYSAAGSRNFAIERGFGLQQATLLFKAGDGIYAVTGAPPFNVPQISTANIIAPDCACVMEDAVWAYTDQGILRVSDAGGASVISRPIETELNRLRALFPDETHNWSFAVPYEQERRILFFVPFDVSAVSGRPQMKAWCYNVATQAWTGPVYSDMFSGVVAADELRLKLGFHDTTWTGRVTSERNSQDFTDYADFSFSATLSNVDVGGNPLIVRFSIATGIAAGDGISQGSTWATRIRRARPDIGERYFELYEDVPFTAASVTIWKAYDVELQFQPQGNPSARKTLTRLAWLFKPEWFESFTATTLVMTDQIQANAEISTPSVGFGSTPFGQGPFGNPTPLVVDVNPIAPKWTNAAQFFVGLTTSEAWMKLRLQGFVLRLETNDAPTGRGR